MEPAVGAMPVVQSELAFCPGVIVIVHVAPAANVVLAHPSLVMLVFDGKPLGVTVVISAGLLPMFLMVIVLGLPVNAALVVVVHAYGSELLVQFTDNAKGKVIGRNTAKVVPLGALETCTASGCA